LSIPKKAVKEIVKELRNRENIPSWWESQTYKGDDEEKDRIRAAYDPYLPVPPVGVHRILADEMDLKPGTIYQAIKVIRLEANLPQYNDPTLHAEEFAAIREKARLAKEAAAEAKAAADAEAALSTALAETADTTANQAETEPAAPTEVEQSEG
jgi:hypothetical protein